MKAYSGDQLYILIPVCRPLPLPRVQSPSSRFRLNVKQKYNKTEHRNNDRKLAYVAQNIHEMHGFDIMLIHLTFHSVVEILHFVEWQYSITVHVQTAEPVLNTEITAVSTGILSTSFLPFSAAHFCFCFCFFLQRRKRPFVSVAERENLSTCFSQKECKKFSLTSLGASCPLQQAGKQQNLCR